MSDHWPLRFYCRGNKCALYVIVSTRSSPVASVLAFVERQAALASEACVAAKSHVSDDSGLVIRVSLSFKHKTQDDDDDGDDDCGGVDEQELQYCTTTMRIHEPTSVCAKLVGCMCVRLEF